MRVPSRAGRTVLAGSTALLLALAAAPTAVAHPAPDHRSAGSLVLVGGGLKDDNDQVYGEIIDRAGGKGHARIGVLTAASVPESQDPHAGDPATCSNSACNGAYYADLFTRHGAADAQWIPVDIEHVAAADSDRLVEQINGMTGFFFGGGDQYRYVTSLMHGAAHTDSKVLAAIRAKLARGAVVAGSSAGAQIMAGTDMITGGESYEGLRDGSRAGYFEDASKLGYLPQGGFGFLRSGLLDTHTGTSGREGRSLRLAADTGHQRVYALEENTALVVEHVGSRDESMQVVGPQGLAVFDLRHARTREGAAGWSLTGADYSYLTDGDRYDPRHWRVRPAADRTRLHPQGRTAVPENNDVFYSLANADGVPYSFLGTARALASSAGQREATASTYESGPRFTVTFAKDRRFTALTSDGTEATTLIALHVSIDPT
ncbi:MULTISPECIES: cyanophycinase [unclassified Streptomyces]|uniref:cyanophycinase n=1 Tax=unclassified Streptomyces TaxID=2593676 RepID=UPI000CDAA644|nr:cyanophycinase [Streptomyces sp. SM10]